MPAIVTVPLIHAGILEGGGGGEGDGAGDGLGTGDGLGEALGEGEGLGGGGGASWVTITLSTSIVERLITANAPAEKVESVTDATFVPLIRPVSLLPTTSTSSWYQLEVL